MHHSRSSYVLAIYVGGSKMAGGCGSYALCKILGCPARHAGAHRVSYTVNCGLGIVRGLAGIFW